MPHLLYGHVSVREALFGGPLCEDAAAALAEARAQGKLPIFAGGTGLYFMALTDGLADIPPIPPEIRDAARALLEEIGVAALHARLAARDPQDRGAPSPQRSAARAARL